MGFSCFLILCWYLLSWVSDSSVSIIMANHGLESEDEISFHTWPLCQETTLLLRWHPTEDFLLTALRNTTQSTSSLWGDTKVFTLSIYSLICCLLSLTKHIYWIFDLVFAWSYCDKDALTTSYYFGARHKVSTQQHFCLFY